MRSRQRPAAVPVVVLAPAPAEAPVVVQIRAPVVDQEKIQNISLSNLDETVTAMYTLMEPAMDNLTEQIYEAQSTDNLTYAEDNQYTSMVLINAINQALDKAKVD